MMTRRLFLFASFLQDGQAGAALRRLVGCLDSLGDVVYYADSDASAQALDSLAPITLYAGASRHGEYDFGSYKRCLRWAEANLDLASYDYLYLVNDSVFGPLRSLEPYLVELEASGRQALCLAYCPDRKHPHMQSWFVGLGPDIFRSAWFKAFLEGVSAEADKQAVCVKYETGLSELIAGKGYDVFYLFRTPRKAVYNSPLALFRKGFPFVKKSSFVRHEGCLGHGLGKIMLSTDAAGDIVSEAGMLWGVEYVESLLACSRIESAWRYLKYLYGKISRSRDKSASRRL